MYDLSIIGAGAAGIACAAKAAAQGLKTVLFEKKREVFGGTCLNQGCIPTKFFLNSSKLHKTWPAIFSEKEEMIEKIKSPALQFLEKEGVDIRWGAVSFKDQFTLNTADGGRVAAKNIIVAVGSSPKKIINHKKCVFAQDIFSLSNLSPNNFIIVGAGYIGLEIASLLNSFGKNVLIVEKEESILPFFDRYLTSRLRVLLEKKGIQIQTGKDIADYDLDKFDMVILAVGREAAVSDLGLEKVGILLDEKGWIKTNAFQQTNIDNIYACGDVSGKKLLAYTAEYQAKLAVRNILGEKVKEDYTGVAECVFSLPQLAKVGILEQEAKDKNLRFRIIKSNFLKSASAYVYNDTDGFVQVLVDEEDRIIGAGIISNLSAELISLFSLCVKNKLSLEHLRKCLFIHPTLSEIMPHL